MQWYNPELTCISLMTSDTEVEYLFRSLFTVHKSSLMEFLSKCFALFFNRSFAFLLLSFENYLSILDTFYKSFLKYVYYKIFLPVWCLLYYTFNGTLHRANFFLSSKANVFFFSYIDGSLIDISKTILPITESQRFSSKFSTRSFIHS